MFTPPTDSLYKFLAIAGIVMVMWGVSYPWNKSYESKLEGAGLKVQIKEVGQRAEYLKSLYAHLSSENDALDINDKDFDAKKEAIRKRKMELYIQLLEAQNPIDKELAKLQVISEEEEKLYIIGWASILFGGVFAILGFSAWYIKIQRHIDREMAIDKNGS